MRVRRIAVVLATTCVVMLGAAALPGVRSDAATSSSTVVRRGVKAIHPAGRKVTAAATANITLHSTAVVGAVATQPKVYLVFWGSQWSSDPAGAATALQNYFQGAFGPGDTWTRVQSQYCGGMPIGTQICGAGGQHIQHPSSTVLAGVWFDNAAASPTNQTDIQIAAEANSAATHFGNSTQASNANAIYVIAAAHGTHPDGFPNSGFCAWHSSTSGPNGTVAYTNLPYIPDLGAGGCTTISSPTLLDGYFSTETHEYAESVTDMWPNNGWLDATGEENADLCVDLDARLTLTTGTFDVQGVWSNLKGACVTAQTETPPSAPNAPVATAGSASASVAFSAPSSNGGYPVLTYQVTASPGGATATGTTSPITVPGLTNGQTYTFKVAAINTVGAGAASAASNAVVPGATTRTVPVSWTATESARLNQMAPLMGTNAAGVQKASVYVISFLLGFAPATPDPQTLPAPGSAVTYTDTWQANEFSVIDRVKNKFVLDDAGATRASVQIVSFLFALGGH